MKRKALLAAVVAMAVVQSTSTFASTGKPVGDCSGIGGWFQHWGLTWSPCHTN